MPKKTAFVKQAAILAAAGILVRIIGFAYRLPLTHLIKDEGNGIYGQSYYLYTFFLIMSSAGLPAAISKMVSERLAHHQYRNAHLVFRISLAVAAISGLLLSLALGLGAQWLSETVGFPDSYYSILTLAPTIFIVAIMAVFRGYFQGMHSTIPTAISQFVEQIFNAVFSVYLAYILLEHGLVYAVAGATAGTGIGALVGLLIILIIYAIVSPVFKRKMRRQPRSNSEQKSAIVLELIKTALPIIIGTAVFSMTNIIDMQMVKSRLLVGGFSEREAKTLYGQLSGKYATLTTLPVSISTAIATASIPSIASSIALRRRREANRKINAALKLTMIISIPAAVGLGVLGDQILMLLFPTESSGGSLLRIGSVSIIFLTLSQITTGMLQGAGHVKIPAIAAICGGLLKIPVNYFLISIPEINVNGAVISTTCCYIVASTIDLVMLKRLTNIHLDLTGCVLKPLLASAAMGLSAYIAYHFIFILTLVNALACIAAIIIAAFIYTAYMLVIQGITINDIYLLPGGKKIAVFLQKNQLL